MLPQNLQSYFCGNLSTRTVHNMGFIVVTNPAGDKHVQAATTETFWMRHNARLHPSMRVKIEHFEEEKDAVEFQNKATPDVAPIPKHEKSGKSLADQTKAIEKRLKKEFDDKMEAEVAKRVAEALKKAEKNK